MTPPVCVNNYENGEKKRIYNIYNDLVAYVSVNMHSYYRYTIAQVQTHMLIRTLPFVYSEELLMHRSGDA